MLEQEADLLLGQENIVKVWLWHDGPHNIEDICCDLGFGIGQAVEGIVNGLLDHLVLHCNLHEPIHQKNSFRLARHIGLGMADP